MPAPTTHSSVREVFPGHDDFIPALNLAIASCSKVSRSVAPGVRDVLESESVGGLRLRPLVGANAHNILRFAVVAVESPGASNVFLLPFELGSWPGRRRSGLATGPRKIAEATAFCCRKWSLRMLSQAGMLF